MKKYNLHRYDNLKFNQVTKKELFNLFDDYHHSKLFEFFAGDFNSRYDTGYFLVKEKFIDENNPNFNRFNNYYYTVQYLTFSAFKITDVYGYQINLEKIISEYKESRKIKKIDYSKNQLFRKCYGDANHKYRKRMKQKFVNPFRNSKTKQFQKSDEYLKEFPELNINKKRSKNNIENIHVEFEERCYRSPREAKSWKDKKIKKQWMKNKK